MNIEQLMKPRYKVVADYPGSENKKGDIIEYWKTGCYTSETFCEMYDRWPDIYRKLQWWDRDVNEMPEYIRYGEWDEQHSIYKVVKYNPEGYETYFPCAIAENHRVKDYFLPHFQNSFPATAEEYNTQQNKK